MPAFGPYLVAILATVIFLVAVALASFRLRILILPGWDGSRARLAEAVLAIGLATTIGLVLGTLALLNRPALLAASIGLALLIEWRFRRGLRSVADRQQSQQRPSAPAGAPATAERSDPSGPPRLGEQPPYSRLAALAVIVLVFAHWGVGVSWSLDAGITNFDSVWYHLPFSAEMAQSGSTLHLIRTDTVFLNWLYPQGSELQHALGMVLSGRDVASLALNLAWLGLAFLAAWCIGRPYGRGHLTVAAAAIPLECHNLVAREPGTAKNDIVAIALLLAAAALLVNLAYRPAPAPGSVDDERHIRGVPHRPRFGGETLRSGWAFALVALAAGLAAGTKVTALAPVAGLTLAALVLSPAGGRRRAALWWGGGLVIGGGYWYLRNIVVAGNPLPQVRSIGPLGLPGPDRLQTGRPDFTVSHYLFDGAVWRDYLVPGLERGLGQLWPLVVAAAVAGGLLAVAQLVGDRRRSASRGSRPDARGEALHGAQGGRQAEAALIGWLGLAALLGMVAYLFTPLGAAGPEGSPTAFAINLRFVIPALILGLVLLPLALPLRHPRSAWLAFALLTALCLVTNRAETVLSGSGRPFGWFLALALIAVPAALLRLSGGPSRGTRLRTGLALAYVAILVLVCFPLQRGYFENRYADFQPQLGLSEVYRWASEERQTRIGLAGTTLGFHGFGFYGADLSNRVTYLGAPAPRGGFDAISVCVDFRREVNRQDLDYLVTAPFLNFFEIDSPIVSPEARWVASDPAVEAEIVQGDVTLWRLNGPLRESCGPTERPHRQLPDSPAA